MHRDSTGARRRRHTYMKNAYANTLAADLQSTQQLIPEEDFVQGEEQEEEEGHDEDDPDTHNERSHLISVGDSPTISPRHNSESGTACTVSSTSRELAHTESQPEKEILLEELVEQRLFHYPLPAPPASAPAASKQQPLLRSLSQPQTQQQQKQQQQAVRKHPLLQRVHGSSFHHLHHQQQQKLLQQQQLQQQQQQQDINMTIPPAAANSGHPVSPPPVSTASFSNIGGAGGGGCVGGSGAGQNKRGATHTTGVTRALSFPFTSPPSTTIAGSRTPVTRKRTRFHQRSMTMATATSPSLIQPGSMSEEVALMEKTRHLDLAATYHGGTAHSRHKTRSTHNNQGSKSSTPSMLFTKVKERIREKVFQSSEWSSAAAMIHEKRQRANDMLEASLNSRTNLNIEKIQYHEKQRKKTTLRSKSDSGKYSPCASTSQVGAYGEPCMVAASGSSQDSDQSNNQDKEVAKQAFRRRSISEDTYDRPPTSIVMKKNGIVCSNEDLDVIMQEQHSIQHSRAYKNRRSPRPLKKHLRTQSLDIARLTAKENQQGQGGSGSIYLDPQVSMASSSSTVSSIRTIDSTESDMNVRSSDHLDTPHSVITVVTRSGEVSPSASLYPEIVLDDRSKETIMEETSNEKNVEVEEQIIVNGKKKPKPVPEVIFDENGQTWDVYGADFDPEVLGLAIQRHLENMMEKMMASATSPTEEDFTEGKSSPASNGEQTQVESKRDSNSFWLRLLCLFAGRSDVGT